MNKALLQKFVYERGKPIYFALFSDLHIDAAGHNRQKLIHDLDTAIEHDARIYINGDLFDFILPGDRKRYTRGGNEIDNDDQIGEIVRMGVKILSPYVDHIDLIGMGNHETAVLKFHHIDAVRLLIWELQKARNPELPHIHHGGYTGFIRHSYRVECENSTGAYRNYTIWYHHGVGGSSPVTKGMIDFNRAQIMADADLYWMGHKHTSITDDGIKRLVCNHLGEVKVVDKLAVFTGGYKKAASLDIDYMERGYGLNYSEEQHMGLQSDGFKLLKINPAGYLDQLEATIYKG